VFDEREYIRRLEAAGPTEFESMVRTPTVAEENALRAYLGDDRYRRLHSLALRTSTTRRIPVTKGNVVILHGIMGGELTASRGGGNQHIWARVFRLMAGGIARLRLGEDGRSEADGLTQVQATGILKKHYGEQILRLNQNWNTRTFWYDWRKPLDIAADELRARITSWFGPDARVHLVAHSMGGLVARTYIARHRDHWNALRDDGMRRGGRLVMLGTPNHGSFAVPHILTGLEHMVRLLARVDLRHSREEIMAIVRTFIGVYEMMPSPHIDPAWTPLYDSATWGVLGVPQRHLDHARAHHDLLAGAGVDAERMLYVAGSDQATWNGVADWARLGSTDGYTAGYDGDGRVPHRLGLLDGVATWYVRAEHGALPQTREILAVIDELLETGTTGALSHDPIVRKTRGAADARAVLEQQLAEDEREVDAYLLRSRTRRGTVAAPEPARLSVDERRVEELITRGFLSTGDESVEPAGGAAEGVSITPSIEVEVVVGDIEHFTGAELDPAVDAIAVGHYADVRPQQAELALDRALSKRLGSERLIVTDLNDRGALPTQLGRFFIIPDDTRMAMIAGMGVPGRFGVPELTLLARELLWTAGKLGRRHVATVLIGSGSGNLSIEDAAESWLRGMKHALSGVEAERCVRRVIFLERDAARALELDAAIARIADTMRPRFEVIHRTFDDAEREALEKEAQKQERAARQRRMKREREAARGGVVDAGSRAPTRVTLSLTERTYRFGAITDTASVPERAVELDPVLVRQANDELAASFDPTRQLMNGRVLERLLVPEDLRAHLSSGAPLVLLLDATTARVHWEMMVQPGVTLPQQPTHADVDYHTMFLGTARGLTRQLRTGFAPPPEPPPPPRRVLRVLVVADPAEDAHLPGAEEEGAAVADLFESYNVLHARETGSRIEVKRLFGPRDATRLNVLREVLLHSYDVLHFAGHCVYDEERPAESGWLFSHGQILSAYELDRIDRVPKFVVSNACESGITPDRAEERNAHLAPGFAEAFFKRGVANFVCTAWPIDDVAASTFALRMYGDLLGIQDGAADRPRSIMSAMRTARLAIADTPNGLRSWGAYQHYGNPYFRLFEPEQ
jgi:pimeloyl-ACP methyl ester carboxylesterase